ncbi:hypothetical protein EMGBS15_07580 [Filimonas sp.]|nr:hypothetical protein EMGBS15_07580 [Filimonas sp.]
MSDPLQSMLRRYTATFILIKRESIYAGNSSFSGLNGWELYDHGKRCKRMHANQPDYLTSVNTLMFLSFTSSNVGCNGTPLATIMPVQETGMHLISIV